MSRATIMNPTNMRALYEQEGYVVVPGLLGTHKQAIALQKASDRVIQRTHEGKWPHRRPVGRQFPPYDAEEKDSWGVQHLMHPDLHEPSFSAWYTSDTLLQVIKELLACQDDDLQMELFNLLINPATHNFALRWHRDDIPDDATEDEEIKALNVWHHGVQWNTALYEDACLLLVPRSHKYSRTPEQRAKSSGPTLADPLDVPGSIRITLQPGDTVFYNSNILHCGTYSSAEKRATLHASLGSTKGGSSRATNVLQHGLEWMRDSRFRDSLVTERGKGMLDNLLDMYNSVPAQSGTTYSLKN